MQYTSGAPLPESRPKGYSLSPNRLSRGAVHEAIEHMDEHGYCLLKVRWRHNPYRSP